MARASYRASAPGNLMLLGEHAVLHGELAIACAVTRRIHVTLRPRPDQKIQCSSALGEVETDIHSLQIRPPFQFVLNAVASQRERLTSGFRLTIESEFSSQIGLGSSAAVTVATVAALGAWQGIEMKKDEIFHISKKVVRDVQGVGSGADVAAGVYGGIVSYRMEPFSLKNLNHLYPIAVVYSGHKESTRKVIERVRHAMVSNQELFRKIYHIIGQSSEEAEEAISQRDWATFGRILNINQGLMEAIGTSTRSLSNMVYALRDQPLILGAKISGAGLGDCVVGLGVVKPGADIPGEMVEVDMTEKGVTLA